MRTSEPYSGFASLLEGDVDERRDAVDDHTQMPNLSPFACLILLGVLGCAPAVDEITRGTWTEAERAELLKRVAEDQAVRERLTISMRAGTQPDTAVIRELTAVDSINTEWFSNVVAQRGWPDRAIVGPEGARAAFLLVQHADRDTAFQVRVLPLLEAAYRRGQAEGQHVALLTDRIATARGEPQVYGTQTDMRDGRIRPKPIRDSASVDARRASMGLPPLAEYLRVLDSIYLGRGSADTAR